MTFIISQISHFEFMKTKNHEIITEVTIIRTKIITNFRKKVENFEPKIFRSKGWKFELKLYFQGNFVLLSRFCFTRHCFDSGFFCEISKITEKAPKIKILCWINFIFRSSNIIQYLSNLDEKWTVEKVNICSLQVLSTHLGELIQWNSFQQIFRFQEISLKFRNLWKFWNQHQNNFIFKKSYAVEYSSELHEK